MALWLGNIDRVWTYDWETEIEHELIISSEIQKCRMSWQTCQDVHLTLAWFADLGQYTNWRVQREIPICNLHDSKET